MCSNDYDLAYLNSFTDQDYINELQTTNNFIEIIYKTNNHWKKECFQRDQFISSIIKNIEDTVTLLGIEQDYDEASDVNKRFKMLGYLPYTGEYIIDESVRLLYINKYVSFLKIDCMETKVGSYKAVSSTYNVDKKVCKLIPLIKVNPPLPERRVFSEYFTIKFDEESSQIYRVARRFKIDQVNNNYNYIFSDVDNNIKIGYTEITTYPTLLNKDQVIFSRNKLRKKQEYLETQISITMPKM